MVDYLHLTLRGLQGLEFMLAPVPSNYLSLECPYGVIHIDPKVPLE